MIHRCIVKDNDKVRETLNNRFKKLLLTNRAITSDANQKGRKFNEASLSRYRNHGNIPGAILTDDVIWLCDRYNIKLKLIVTKGKLNG